MLAEAYRDLVLLALMAALTLVSVTFSCGPAT
jgi:hypothetical protein